MKTIQLFLLVLIIIGLGLIFTRDKWVPQLVQIILSNEKSVTPVPIPETENKPNTVITNVDIKETNFTGKKPVIIGVGLLVSESNTYIEKVVAEFKTQADRDVPDIREKFGKENPTANYTIDINAKNINTPETESVVISIYTYTGGAHGSSYYKVFNLSTAENKISTMTDIIRADKQTFFTELVKKELNNWRPDGTVVVFPDTVAKLTFASFKNWTLDDKNINIYFDQYEIGPGVLGAVIFPISREKIKDFLN